MKKIFTFLLLSIIAQSSFAQQTGSYDELMKKSRKARTISIIMVSTGPVIAVGGVSTMIYGIIENDLAEPNYIYDGNGNYTVTPAKKFTNEIVIGAVATVVGLGVALTSIYFSNKASDLKRQARKMKLKTTSDNLSIPGLQGSYANHTTQYKLSLLIPLGR